VLASIAGWIAPIATIIAAMMTAANLGARVTGWGFVVFVLGSVSWSIVGVSSGQTNLLASNGFLTLVNLIGVWRWLGRQRSYEDGGKSAENASWRSSAPTLFTATGIAGMPVEDRAGQPLGKAVEALIECATGEVSYVVVASGGVGGIDERLRAVPRTRIDFRCDGLRARMTTQEFTGLPVLAEGDWPAQAQDAMSSGS
jgi:hypothetical protein